MQTILEHKKQSFTIEQKNIITEVMNTYNLYDFVATIICIRNNFDINEIKEYIIGTTKPKDFKELKDILTATTLISDAITQNKNIRIVGDYDVDGVTSTYVLLTIFEMLGYKNISHYLPVRENDGYGLNPNIVDNAHKDGVELIITVDNGISATEAVSHAKSLGMTVIVTDHHELPDVLPESDATINPHQPDCNYPYKSLAGVGIAYKLGQSLISHFKIRPNKDLILRIQGLVALGTVCDVAPLIGENRHMVKTGLIALNNGAIPSANAISQKISVGALGFQIGPRLNACGRLESAETALKYLMTSNISDIMPFKAKLDSLNKERQDEEMDSIDRVLSALETLTTIPDIIVHIDETAHESIVGLVAGRIKEKYYRPTVVFSKTKQGTYKGSGRSIEEYDMFQSFKPYMHLIDGGGGHPMACGLKATTKEQIYAFSDAINNACTLTEHDKTPKIYVDKTIDNSSNYDFNLLETQLKLFLPTGAGNSAPTILVRDIKTEFKTKYAKQYRISEVKAYASNKLFESTLWNDDSLPESGQYMADIILQVSESGWQIKHINLSI